MTEAHDHQNRIPYVDEPRLLADLESKLLEVWSQSGALTKIADFKNLPAYERIDGVTFVGPTQGKLRSVTNALQTFCSDQLGREPFFVEGTEPDFDQIETAARARRHVWIVVPMSSCSMARLWSVHHQQRDKFLPELMRMDVLTPNYLSDTYLGRNVLERELHANNDQWFNVTGVAPWEDAPESGESAGSAEEGQSRVDHTGEESIEYMVRTFGGFGEAMVDRVEYWARKIELIEGTFD